MWTMETQWWVERGIRWACAPTFVSLRHSLARTPRQCHYYHSPPPSNTLCNSADAECAMPRARLCSAEHVPCHVCTLECCAILHRSFFANALCTTMRALFSLSARDTGCAVWDTSMQAMDKTLPSSWGGNSQSVYLVCVVTGAEPTRLFGKCVQGRVAEACRR